MSSLHPSTFEYLKPTDDQLVAMQKARLATANYAAEIDNLLPIGPDKTYILRKLREIGLWVNTAITREADGTPRK